MKTKMIVLVFILIFIMPSMARAETCTNIYGGSLDYTCQCNDTTYTEITSQLSGITELSVAQSTCASACNDISASYNVTGSWKVFCAGSLKGTGDIIATRNSTGETVGSTEKDYTAPNLAIPIPGLTFSKSYERDGTVFVPYLGEYVVAIYNLAIVIGAIATILTLMIAGLRWMVARGDAGAANEAQRMMGKGVVAMIILLSVTAIITLVDPGLSRIGSIPIPIVQPQEFVFEDVIKQNLQQCADVEGSVSTCGATIFKNPGNWDEKLVNAINKSAQSYGVDPIQIAAHIELETRHVVNWNASTDIGPCGEIGPSQFMPTTYETISGDNACCTAVSKKSGDASKSTSACGDTYVEWPPDPSQIPHCNTSICGTCQVASTSCAEKFNSPDNIQFVTDMTAQLIRRLNNKTGDLALAMCAYNGSGEQATSYAQSAAGHYARLCAISQ